MVVCARYSGVCVCVCKAYGNMAVSGSCYISFRRFWVGLGVVWWSLFGRISVSRGHVV
jgi:hypothetical protein